MHYISHPSPALVGEINVPGDKSISHRALILASIAQGTTLIQGILESQDCLATKCALQSMGVSMDSFTPGTLLIKGEGKYSLKEPQQVIDCGNSGTTLRLLTGLLAAQSFDSQLTGDVSLLNRPMDRLTQPLTQMGALIETTKGKAPIYIRGSDCLKGIRYKMPLASAQVKSGLLLAGLYAEGETHIIEPYVLRDHTERMLATLSCPIHKTDNAVRVNALGECFGGHLDIPGDFSSAAFFIVAATILPGSSLVIKNVGINPTRTGLLVLLKQMGAHIEVFNKKLFGEEPVADIAVRYAPLEGITISPAMVPLAIDEFPILFIAAAAAKGQTLLHGARELRYKESDRIFAMASGLQALGIEAQAAKDGIFIQGGTFQGGTVESFHDHRVAMAFSIAGAVSQKPVTIRDCQWIETSYPDFLSTALSVRLSIEVFHDNE